MVAGRGMKLEASDPAADFKPISERRPTPLDARQTEGLK